jgi:hypothetical protein
MSASPKSTGILEISFISSFSAPISVEVMLWFLRSAMISTSFNCRVSGSSLKLICLFSVKLTVVDMVLYPRYETISVYLPSGKVSE